MEGTKRGFIYIFLVLTRNFFVNYNVSFSEKEKVTFH